jgi:hypothetical protein
VWLSRSQPKQTHKQTVTVTTVTTVITVTTALTIPLSPVSPVSPLSPPIVATELHPSLGVAQRNLLESSTDRLTSIWLYFLSAANFGIRKLEIFWKNLTSTLFSWSRSETFWNLWLTLSRSEGNLKIDCRLTKYP